MKKLTNRTRMADNLPCKKCNTVQWKIRQRHRNGYQYTTVFCVRCNIDNVAQWQKDNKKRMREHNKKSYAKYLESNREKRKQYAQENKEAAQKRGAVWYAANKEHHIKKGRIWRAANKERVRENNRKLRLANPERTRKYSRLHYWADAERARELARNRQDSTRGVRNNKRRALKANAPGSFTVEDINLLREVQNSICAMPWCDNKLYKDTKDPNHKETIDHIVPLLRGGSNQLGNLRLVCKSCNSRKGTKTTAETMKMLLDYEKSK